MKVLFMTMGSFDSIESHSLYPDLLRCFRNNGNEVYTIAPGNIYESDYRLLEEQGSKTVHILLNNLTGSRNLIKKGFAQISVGSKYIKAIKLFFSDVCFDLILYSTPPISLVSAIEYIKKRDKARTYLLLKDIFPQNAVDIGLLRTTGIKGLLYKHFRKQEKKLYKISDRIGCMSQANVDYVINHNPEVDPNIVEICPNSIEVIDKSINEKTRIAIRNRYGIPLNKIVFVYGGNLGKPQGIPFLIECLKECEDVDGAFFIIVGDGTEYQLIKEFVESSQPTNVKLMQRLPKEDYDTMVGACDVGMIFLDHRFTIPNFPSRLLSYMQAKLPVLACTDSNTDIGKIITDGGFGWWCESNDPVVFFKRVKEINAVITKQKKQKSWQYLCLNYSVKCSFNTIEHFIREDER